MVLVLKNAAVFKVGLVFKPQERGNAHEKKRKNKIKE